MCVFTRQSYTHSSLVQLLLTILSLYQVDVQTKHARNKEHFSSTKRINIKRRTRAIYYWYYNTRSSPADVKQNKRSREYHRKIQNFSNYLPFGNDANFGNYPDAADVKTQPKSQDYIIKVQYFCNFSLVLVSIDLDSRRGAQRIRKGEGRWSRPPKTFTRWSRRPKTFTRGAAPRRLLRVSFVQALQTSKQNKQTLKPCRRQAKQTLESMPPQNSKHYNNCNYLPFGNYANFVNYPGAKDVKIQPKHTE